MGNETGFLQSGSGSLRTLMSGNGLSGQVQFHSASQASQYPNGIPEYTKGGQLSGVIVGQDTTSTSNIYAKQG